MTNTLPECGFYGGCSALEWDGASEQTVLLLHGLGDSACVWSATVAALGPSRPRVVALDLPGHGARAQGSDALSLDMMADAVRGAAAALGGPLTVVGHSLGARIAARVARDVPDVAALVVVDTAAHHSAAAHARLLSHMDMLRQGAPSKTALAQHLCDQNPLADHVAMMAYIDAAAQPGGDGWCMPVPGTYRSLLGPDPELLEVLGACPCPVTIVRGAFSSVCTRADAEAMVAASAHSAPLVTVDRAGHAIPLEQPVPLARALAEVISA